MALLDFANACRRKLLSSSYLSQILRFQLPMFNEFYVYERAINYACDLGWPRSHLFVQVLDDSTDENLKKAIDIKVMAMRSAGHNITVLRRMSREGFKAGSLQNGLGHLEEIKYVTIFEADFAVPLPEAHLQSASCRHVGRTPMQTSPF